MGKMGGAGAVFGGGRGGGKGTACRNEGPL